MRGPLRLEPHARARLVEHVDRAVRQLVVTQVPGRQLRRRLERVVGERHAVVRLVAGTKSLKNLHRLGVRGLVNRDFLQTARERTVLLDVLELLVRGRADDAKLTGGQYGLDERRQVHRSAGRRAGAHRGVNLVDEEDGHRPLRQRVNDGLETLFEVAAESRAGEERGRVEREHLRPLEGRRHVVVRSRVARPFGQRRLADAGVADEHRVVLAPPAQDLHRPLQLGRPADERIELARFRARGQVHRVRARADRARCPCRARRTPASASPDSRLVAAAGRRRRNLADAVGDVLEHVEARHALRRKELRRIRLLLQRGREHVARLHFLASRALHVQDRRLQHAPEGQRLLGFLLLAAAELLDGFLQVLVEVLAKLRQIGAAGGENPLAVEVVRQGVQEMLEREMRVPPRRRFAVGHRQHDLERGTKH